jgi:hypothetical protein
MERGLRSLALLALALAPQTVAWTTETPLAVRASGAVLPCAAAAARAYPHGSVSVTPGGFRDLSGADAFVGAAAEVTRALESGAAVLRSEVDIAEVPWVLVVPEGNPQGLRGAADLPRTASEVWVLDGVAGAHARRALAGVAPERVKPSEDPRALQAAPVALVPLSLAGRGERLATEVAPLLARAVVAEGAPHSAAAAAFVRYLGSEPGQRAFAACGERQP